MVRVRRAAGAAALCTIVCGVLVGAPAGPSGAATRRPPVPAVSVPASTVQAQAPAPYSFDGMSLEAAVRTIAPSDLVSYGTVGENGTVRDGELWLTVHKDKRDVYYHLEDTREPGTTDGSYKGYRILLKAQIGYTSFKSGVTHTVPLFGRTRDAYASVELRVFANASLAGPPRPAATAAARSRQTTTTRRRQGTAATAAPAVPATALPASGVAAGVATTLVEKGSVVQSMQLPVAGGGASVRAAGFNARGRRVTDVAATNTAVTAYTAGSPNCAQIGEDVQEWAASAAAAGGRAASWGSTLAGLATAVVSATGAPGYVAGAIGAQKFLVTPMVWAGQHLAAPFWGSVTKAACELATVPNPGTRPSATLRPPVQSPSLFEYFECVRFEVVGRSTGTYTEDGVEITYTEEVVCTEYGFVSSRF